MRFDLTVNEFTRDLWADRDLEVFGEQFWRPYVHVRDAARGIRTVLDAPVEVAGEVFNVGHSDENYRKLDLVEIISGETRPRRRRLRAPRRGPARLQGRLRQDRATARLPSTRVPDGIREIIAALDEEAFGDPFDPRYRNVA